MLFLGECIDTNTTIDGTQSRNHSLMHNREETHFKGFPGDFNGLAITSLIPDQTSH